MENQYDIIPFLEALGKYDKKDPKYDKFVQNIKVSKEKEQRKAEYIANAPKRKAQRIDAAGHFSTFLLVMGWILFASGAVIVFWPFIQIGSFDLSNSMMAMFDVKRDVVIVASTIAFLCFTARFKNPDCSGVTNIFSAIWSAVMQFFLSTAYMAKYQNYMRDESEYWKYSGVLLLTFVLCNVYGARTGAFLNRIVFHRNDLRGEYTHIGAGEICFMIFTAFSYGIGFFYIKRFFETGGNTDINSNYLPLLVLWAIPIILCILFRVNRGSFGVASENLFSATAQVYFAVLILLLFHLAKDQFEVAIFAWFGVIVIGVILCIASATDSLSGIPGLLIAMLIVPLIVGPLYCIGAPGSNGLKTLKWWIMTPIILTSVVAVKNVIFHIAGIRQL